MPLGYFMTCAIMLHHKRMIDGEVCGLLFEVDHWIPAGSHHFADQTVCLNHSGLRIIDELRLN